MGRELAMALAEWIAGLLVVAALFGGAVASALWWLFG